MTRVIFLLMLLCAPLGCTSESQKPTHIVEMKLSQSDLNRFIAALDVEMAKYGLKSVGAAPGLDKLAGRKVHYSAYKISIKSPYAALDMTDIKVEGRMEIFIYADFFSESSMRTNFVDSVSRLVKEYGGNVVTSNRNP